MKPEDKKCGESCGCDNTQDVKLKEQEEPTATLAAATKTKEIKLDPTHFGDWQINGRAIDF